MQVNLSRTRMYRNAGRVEARTGAPKPSARLSRRRSAADFTLIPICLRPPGFSERRRVMPNKVKPGTSRNSAAAGGQVVRLRASLVCRLQGAEGSRAATERAVSEKPRSSRGPVTPATSARRRTKRGARSRRGSTVAIRCDLQPSDRPTLARGADGLRRSGPTRGERRTRTGADRSRRTNVQGRPFGDWRTAEITREALEAFRQQRPTVAGNRDLALLRALFNWAVVGGLVPRPVQGRARSRS